MRPLFRAATALLLCSALSPAVLAAPAETPIPPKPAAVAPAAPSSLASTPAAKPAAAPAPQATRAAMLKRRAAFRHHLARLHDRSPVRVASLDVLPPPRPARLVDMPAQRDGVVVQPETVQIGRPVAQNTSCDSLLCSSYIIMGAGF